MLSFLIASYIHGANSDRSIWVMVIQSLVFTENHSDLLQAFKYSRINPNSILINFPESNVPMKVMFWRASAHPACLLAVRQGPKSILLDYKYTFQYILKIYQIYKFQCATIFQNTTLLN